jgi:hypothetical protein
MADVYETVRRALRDRVALRCGYESLGGSGDDSTREAGDDAGEQVFHLVRSVFRSAGVVRDRAAAAGRCGV